VVARFKATLVAPRWLFLRLKPSSIAIFYQISSTTLLRETQSNTLVLQKTELLALTQNYRGLTIFSDLSLFTPPYETGFWFDRVFPSPKEAFKRTRSRRNFALQEKTTLVSQHWCDKTPFRDPWEQFCGKANHKSRVPPQSSMMRLTEDFNSEHALIDSSKSSPFRMLGASIVFDYDFLCPPVLKTFWSRYAGGFPWFTVSGFVDGGVRLVLANRWIFDQ